jgi:hypothetical protein
MNIFLWIIQILFAAHTFVGAFWKLGNAEYIAPMFPMIPLEAWPVISVIEFAAAIYLVAPLLKKSLGEFTPIAAGVIAAEMLIYSGIYLMAGNTDYSPTYYWFAVAAVAAFIAYGRSKLRPIA